VHPTVRGHALIARLLYAELCRESRTAGRGEPAAIYRAGCGTGRSP